MSYYYTHFGDTQPNSDLTNANLATIYDPEDEIPTVQASLALFQAIGGNVVDGWGADARRATRQEVTRKGVLVADTRTGYMLPTTRCARIGQAAIPVMATA